MSNPIEKFLDQLDKAYTGCSHIPIPENLFNAIAQYMKAKSYTDWSGPCWKGRNIIPYNDTAVNIALKGLNLGSIFGTVEVQTEGIRIQITDVLEEEEVIPKIHTSSPRTTTRNEVKPQVVTKVRQVF